MLENFVKIGEYTKPNSNPEYIGCPKKKSQKAPIVYLLVVEDEIKYIGETRGGYYRPLNYNKNKVMKNQREAIFNTTSNGQKVEVFAYEVPGMTVTVNGLQVDCYLAQDYEKALIQKLKPEWNGRA